MPITPIKSQKNGTLYRSASYNSLKNQRELIETRLRTTLKLRRTRSLPSRLPENFLLSEQNFLHKLKNDIKHQLTYKKHLASISNRSAYIINKVGRAKKVKQAIVSQSLDKSMEIVSAMQQSDESIGFIKTKGLLPATPAPNGEERKMGENGTVYRPSVYFLNNGLGTMYQECSPITNQSITQQLHVNFNETFVQDFFNGAETETSFSFVVTREGISERMFSKRPCSQKQLTGGYSAADFFRGAGIKFDDAFAKFFHLSHLIGWGLGGPQIRKNVNPATAGSNYTILFYIEDVIRQLLTKDGFNKVILSGEIEYHPIYNKLPKVITYTWHWGNNAQMRKSIYPLDSRRPTIQENQCCRALANALSYLDKQAPAVVDIENQPPQNALLATNAIKKPNSMLFFKIHREIDYSPIKASSRNILDCGDYPDTDVTELNL